jgi:hypothetical protein
MTGETDRLPDSMRASHFRHSPERAWRVAGKVERYVCAWTLFVCAVATDSLYWDRRDWDERDRGDPVDDGVYGFGF